MSAASVLWVTLLLGEAIPEVAVKCTGLTTRCGTSPGHQHPDKAKDTYPANGIVSRAKTESEHLLTPRAHGMEASGWCVVVNDSKQILLRRTVLLCPGPLF